jgi:hypothetical protein
MRGPGAALRYLRERERLLRPAAKAGQSAEVKEKGEGEDIDTPSLNAEIKDQNVYVLEEGFVGWVQKYAEDARLTEGYRKEIWKNGYNY